MKKVIFIILFTIILMPIFSQNLVTLGDAINDYTTGLIPYIQKDRGIAVIAFETDRVVLSEYIIDTMVDKFFEKGIRSIVERKDLEVIQRELNYSLSGYVSDETAVRIGHRIGANTVIYGSFRKLDDNNYQFVIRATDVETGKIIYPRT
jgi:TolB-like protein